MPDCPPLLQACKALFDRAYGMTPDPHDDEDIYLDEDPPMSPTPDDLRSITKLSTVALRARHRHNGTLYARSSTHVGNSLIYFYADGNLTSDPVPSSIKYIYRCHDGAFTYAVRRQLPVSDGTLDPFRHYPEIPAKLYSSRLRDELEIVQPEWVMTHFARFEMSDYAVVLSLSQVSVFTLTIHVTNKLFRTK